MKTTIVARKMDLTSGMKDYVEKKLTKLDKFFDDETEAKITMSVEKNRQKIEATIYSHNTIFRVEQVTSDMYVKGLIEAKVINYIYGLGGRDVKTDDIETVYNNLSNIAATGNIGEVFNHLGVRG